MLLQPRAGGAVDKWYNRESEETEAPNLRVEEAKNEQVRPLGLEMGGRTP